MSETKTCSNKCHSALDSYLHPDRIKNTCGGKGIWAEPLKMTYIDLDKRLHACWIEQHRKDTGSKEEK